MAGFRSDTDQVEKFARDLHAAGLQLADLDPANAEAGRVVIAAARPPHWSGALAAALRADATRTGVTFASTVRYWTFVHWGAPRHNVRAQPFYRTAVHASRDELVAVYAAHARTTLEKVT